MKNLYSWKVFRVILFMCVFTYVLIEAVCFAFIQSRYIPAFKPSFNFTFRGKDWKPIFADINPIWGSWHDPGLAISTKDCFKVSYRINSYGARDAERDKEAKSKRVIVLGDSFMEGYGVEENERVSNLLEENLKIDFLNFAASGFGPTQEYLLYKNLAKNFDHDIILIGILPFNDFQDDDREFGLKKDRRPYRPFWVGNYPDYKLTYSHNSIEESESLEWKIKSATSFRGNVTQFLRSYTYWFNIFYYLKYVKPITYRSNTNDNLPYSGYYDYFPEQFDRMKYSLENIQKEANGKEIYVFTIPVQSDLERYEGEKKVSKLGIEFQAFCKSKGMKFMDLLPQTYTDFGEDRSKLFLTCDGHWNPEGNQYVKNLLVEFLKQ